MKKFYNLRARLVKVFMGYEPLDLDIICFWHIWKMELVSQTSLSIFNESKWNLLQEITMIMFLVA